MVGSEGHENRLLEVHVVSPNSLNYDIALKSLIFDLKTEQILWKRCFMEGGGVKLVIKLQLPIFVPLALVVLYYQ